MLTCKCRALFNTCGKLQPVTILAKIESDTKRQSRDEEKIYAGAIGLSGSSKLTAAGVKPPKTA